MISAHQRPVKLLEPAQTVMKQAGKYEQTKDTFSSSAGVDQSELYTIKTTKYSTTVTSDHSLYYDQLLRPRVTICMHYVNVLVPILRPVLNYGLNVTVTKVTVIKGLYCTERHRNFVCEDANKPSD